MIKQLSALLTIFLLVLSWLPPGVGHAATTGLLITEIQIGITSEKNEFVELYNSTTAPLTFQDLRIEYLSSSFTGDLSTQTRILGTFSGTILAHETLLLRNDLYVAPPLAVQNADLVFGSSTNNPTTGFLASSGGYVRIVDQNIQLVDCVRWGGSEASTLAGCQRVAAAHASDLNSLQRPFINGAYQTSYGITDSPMTPRSILNTIDEPEPVLEPDPTPIVFCEGVSISEIVPNPEGEDTDQEFFELFNSKNVDVDLGHCSFRIGDNSIGFGGNLSPGYTAFYGHTLPNSAGAQIAFITPTGELAVNYPGGLGEDESYSYVNGLWQRGALSTPGAANAMPEGSENVDAGTDASSDELEPCAPGKYRHPETNRCRNIEAESVLTPCDPGQVRNPDTNRCRNSSATSSTLNPCGAGETRSPETNRCRKNTSSTATQTPCKEGQERNPETNRCRKVASAKTSNPITNPANASSRPVSYYVLGIVAALALVYGAYEYRHSIYGLLTKRRQKV